MHPRPPRVGEETPSKRKNSDDEPGRADVARERRARCDSEGEKALGRRHAWDERREAVTSGREALPVGFATSTSGAPRPVISWPLQLGSNPPRRPESCRRPPSNPARIAMVAGLSTRARPQYTKTCTSTYGTYAIYVAVKRTR